MHSFKAISAGIFFSISPVFFLPFLCHITAKKKKMRFLIARFIGRNCENIPAGVKFSSLTMEVLESEHTGSHTKTFTSFLGPLGPYLLSSKQIGNIYCVVNYYCMLIHLKLSFYILKYLLYI